MRRKVREQLHAPGSWNYRVVRRRAVTPSGRIEAWYEIRSVYYDGKGRPNGVSSAPAQPSARTQAELRDELARMLAGAGKKVFKVNEAGVKN